MKKKLARNVLPGLMLFGLTTLVGCGSDSGSYEGQGASEDKATQEPDSDAETTQDSGQPEARQPEVVDDAGEEGASAMNDALSYSMTRIDGTSENLSDYRGKVVLMVNVASQCGLTPQYDGLQTLYEEKSDEGLVVLGFPANNFGGQEPGSNEQIAEFCTSEFDVSFPMFAKISVRGEDAHPLYRMLSEAHGEPTWNFTKYLVNREGEVVARFDPRVAPDAPELRAEVDRLLGES